MNYILKIILIFQRDILNRRDYELKNTLISKGTNFTEGTMFLRPFLIPKGRFKPKGLWP